MITPPYYIVPPTKQFKNWKLLSEILTAFRGLSCLPDWEVFPVHITECSWVIECLQEREYHTAYVTAWKNTDSHFVIYFINLYQQVNGQFRFVQQFSGFSAYYRYCKEQLHDKVIADYAQQLQYEYYLSDTQDRKKRWSK